MMEQSPEEQAADLAKLDAMIAADEAAERSVAKPAATTSKAEPRELEPRDTAPESGKQTAPEKPTEPKAEQQKQDHDPDAEAIERDEKGLSPYERQKRKNAREWQRIQKKDAAIAEREAKLAERERALESPKAPPAPQTQSQSDELKIDRGLLEKSMEKWKAEGRSDLLELGQKELDRMNQQAQHSQQRPTAQIPAPSRDPQVDRVMAQSWEQAKNEYPDLLSPGSPLNSEFRKFHQENQDLFEHPKAPLLVAQFVDFKLRAARLPEMSATIERLTKELQDLKTSTSLIPGGSSAEGTTRKFGELSSAEMEAELEREFAGR